MEAFDRYYDGNPSKIKFLDTISMDYPWGYRNKSSLPTRHDGENVVVGMYAINSNKLVYINDCPIENQKINETRKMILDILDREKVDIYNPKDHSGALRYLVIRAFPNSDDVQVCFVLTKEDKKLINVLKKLPVKSANYSINSDLKEVNINGVLGDLEFKISPQAFFQLNTVQTVKLYDKIKEACNLTGKEKVLDCYCGIGSIGMYLADKALEIRGIDTNGEGIENAKEFALMNKVKNAKFYKGDILPHLHQFEKNGFVPDVLVVDPPRRGLELNIINYLQTSKIKRIVYVSCNPATLAKNINHLQKNYVVKYVQPIDMFPHTANVEAVCLLERKK